MFKNGHLSEEEIALYAEALIANKANEIDANFKDHILECDECADKVLSVTEITEDFRAEEQSNLVKTIPLKKIYWLRIAASIVLIAGVGLIIFQVKQVNKPQPPVIADTKDSIITTIDSSKIIKEQTNIIAETENETVDSIAPEEITQTVNENLLAYAVNENLEKLVNRFIEANLRDSFSVDIKSLVEIKSNEEIIFELNNNKELFILEFFNNQGEKLFEEETSENNYKTTRLKEPGLYYWKLLNEDFDLLFCGKIIIR